MHATHTEKTKFFDNDIEKTGAKIMMPSEMGYLVLNNNFLVHLSSVPAHTHTRTRARAHTQTRTHTHTHTHTHTTFWFWVWYLF